MPNTTIDLNAWWESFSKTLSQPGYELDMNNKNDVARLTILHYDAKGTEVDASLNCSETLAFIPQDDKNYKENINIDTMKEEDILNHMVPGKPDEETLNRLYNASRKGLLFIRGPKKLQMGPQQVVTREDGSTSILPDTDHISDEYRNIIQNLQSSAKPKSPGFFNYVKAFFGNQRAKTIVTNYKERKTLYNNSLNFLKKQNKDDLTFLEAMHRGNSNYFQVFGEDDILDRMIKITTMLDDAKLEEKYPGILKGREEVYAKSEEIDKAVIQDARDLKKMQDSYYKSDKQFYITSVATIKDPELKKEVHDKLASILARLVVNQKNVIELKNAGGKGTLNGELLDSKKALFDVNSPEYREEIARVSSDPVFERALLGIDSQTISGLTRNPSAPLAYSSFMSVMKREEKKMELEEIKKEAKTDLEKDEALPFEEKKESPAAEMEKEKAI